MRRSLLEAFRVAGAAVGRRPFATLVRLNKLMKERDLCSRREADALIAKRAVRVDGLVADGRALVRADATVEVIAGSRPPLLTFALHKPRSYISQATNARPGQRFAWELLAWGQQADACRYGHRSEQPPALQQLRGGRQGGGGGALSWDRPALEPLRLPKLGCCGRLDLDSSGLLIFSQDGRVARRLIGEASSVPKHYEVDVRLLPAARCGGEGGSLGSRSYGARFLPGASFGASPGAGLDAGPEVWGAIAARLRHGLALDGRPLLPAEVEWAPRDPEPYSGRPGERHGGSLGGGGGGGGPPARLRQLRVTLREGRYRQLRRMCGLVGLEVVRLQRCGTGGLTLDGLGLRRQTGRWRLLGPGHLAALLGDDLAFAS